MSSSSATRPRHSGRHSDLSPDALLQAVIDISDDAIVICDDKGRVASWSPSAERLFGCSESRSLGATFSDLFAEHLREEVQGVVARMLAGERIVHFESEVVRADGMPLPVSLSVCPLVVHGEEAAGGVIVTRDVTEQRLAQAALAEMEVRLQEGEALAHTGGWLWDLRTGVVQWSTEFHRIHAIDPLDFGGTLQSYLDSVHPEDRDMLRGALETSAASGRPCEEEYRVVIHGEPGDPDVEERVVRIRAEPTIGSDGAVVGLRGVGQIVTRDRRDA